MPPISIQEAIQRTVEHREIFHDEMLALMRQLMAGEFTPAQSAAFLMGLRVKKETIGEVAAAAQVMRELSAKVNIANEPHLVDIVGTGGDLSHTFNISTASMFVAAAAGAKVAKHGNRGVSSKSGAADVLEALGVNIMLTADQIAESIRKVGIGFMFAPNHHAAMKAIAPVRRELGVKTIFNILGPLTNPASAPNTMMGVFHADLVGIQVRVMERLGAKHVMVVHGRDSLDEISLGASTLVAELKDGKITEYEIHPEDFGFTMSATRNLRVDTPEESRAMLLGALEGKVSPALDVVLLNSGAALYTANIASTMRDGIELARKAITSGAARRKVDEFAAFSQTFKA
jgi:anthranilate phosphoribosyltransferase